MFKTWIWIIFFQCGSRIRIRIKIKWSLSTGLNVTYITWDLYEPILPEGENPDVYKMTHLRGEELQPVPVQVQVRQLRQVS